MNVSVDGGCLAIEQAVSRVGDEIVIEVIRSVIVVLSACPQDLALVSGANNEPRGVDVVLSQ